jgi:hypothetical protein
MTLRSLKIYKGSDHILLEEQLLFLQYFNHLFYNEIKGIVAAKTKHFMYYNIANGFCSGLFALFYLPHHSGVVAAFSSLFLLILVINIILGKTYKICIITQVQEKKIGGTFRWRQWNKIKKHLVPLIINEQEKTTNLHDQTSPTQFTHSTNSDDTQ